MSDPHAVLAGVGSAAALTFVLGGLIAWCGPIDPVKTRSSHTRPTPTSGGLAVLAGAAAGLALATALASFAADDIAPVAALLALAGGAGFFGAADDLFDLSPLVKLGALALLALAVSCGVAHVQALPLGPGLELALGSGLGALGGALFLIVLLNTVNFMDGSDGLAVGAAAISLAGMSAPAFLAGEPAVATAALAAAAAAAAFLPWNLRHRAFQGDAGAFFSASMIGGIGLILASWRITTPYLVVFTVLPLITDVLLTLIVRARRRERLLQAHRDHLYQLWLQSTGRPHLQLAVRVWGLTALTTGVGLLLELYARDWAFAGLIATTVLLSGAWVRLRARLRAALPRTSAAGAPRAGRPAGAAGTGTPPNR
ncbi:MAG: hypothetical protein M3M95_08240 [Pseudomonadota bacterium]|nr:hypothetical protein [Pseudomonadota bacterium]